MSEIKKQTNPSHVQSVERALLLVELLSAENHPLTLTEISKKIGWPKSTVHGLLSTLRAYHYVDQSPNTGQYQLGIKFFELGTQVARNWDIRSIALPYMQRLNTELGEMVQLATEDKGEVLYLEKIDSTHLMRIVSEIGVRLPMHCSGLGKVMLAYKTPSEVKWIITQKGLPQMTKRTITSPQELNRVLKQAKQQGYAIDDREIMDGLCCVAVPIWDGNGQVKYALSVSGFSNTMQGQRLEKTIQLAKQAANEISYAMGYRA